MPETRTGSGQLVHEWLERLERLNYSPFTIRGYRLAVTKFFKVYPDVPLEMITPEHIEHHVYSLPVGPRTKASEISHLKAFFTYLVDHKRLLKENPCDRAEKPRWTEKHRPAPSFEDFEALRRRCETLEEAVFLELLYFTGLRVREALGLRVRHVDIQAREIRVVAGKGGKDRTVVFPDRLQILLQRFVHGLSENDKFRQSVTPDDWLFASPRFAGRRRCLEWVGGTLGRLGNQVGLSYRLTAHLLRHGFVRLCKTRGMPIDMAAKQLGHASILTTSRVYGRVDVGDLKKAYDKFLAP